MWSLGNYEGFPCVLTGPRGVPREDSRCYRGKGKDSMATAPPDPMEALGFPS